MERRFLFAATALGYLLGSGWASAQAIDPEVTITLITDSAVELPDVVTRDIALPEIASEVGAMNSAAGLATADENRARAAENREEALSRAEQSRQAGLDIAAEARERGAESGAEIADAARESRADLVRGDVELDLDIPDHLPELPGRAADRANLPDLSDLPGPQ